MTQMKLFMKPKKTHIENRFMVARGKGRWERDELRVWD